MTGPRYTFRSWRAVAISVLTGLMGLFCVAAFFFVALEGTPTTADRGLAFVMVTLAAIPPFLALRMRVSVDPVGIEVRNMIFLQRVAWNDVFEVGVERLDVWLPFTNTSLRPPGLVVNRSVEAFASWGLSRHSRDGLVLAITSYAPRNVRLHKLDPEALRYTPRFRFWNRSDSIEDETLLVEQRFEETIPDEWESELIASTTEAVECVACGRSSAADEMEPFGDEAEAIGWYCRDETECTERSALTRR